MAVSLSCFTFVLSLLIVSSDARNFTGSGNVLDFREANQSSKQHPMEEISDVWRGQHCSRKPVEGQTGNAACGATAASPKTPPASSYAPTVGPASGTSNSLSVAHQQHAKSGQTGLDSSTHISRFSSLERALRIKTLYL